MHYKSCEDIKLMIVTFYNCDFKLYKVRQFKNETGILLVQRVNGGELDYTAVHDVIFSAAEKRVDA